MSSWEGKLNKKLATLTDNASKETIQTVANWVVFNRKHYTIIASTLTKSLQDAHDNPNRKWVYWQLLHEILIADRETPTKWEKLLDLRVSLGEALIPAIEQLGNPMFPSNALSDYFKEWESLNAFGGPLLLSQITRLYQNRNDHSASIGGDDKAKEVIAQPIVIPNVSTTEEATPPSTADSAKKTENATPNPEVVQPMVEDAPAKESPVKRRSSYSQNNNSIDYDFETKVPKQTAVNLRFVLLDDFFLHYS
jgi:hypothetical protein